MNIVTSQCNYVVFYYRWGNEDSCPGSDNNRHMGYIVVDKQEEYDRLTKEHYNGKSWWTRRDLMSVACATCGKMSPLRCDNSGSSHCKDKPPHVTGKIIDYAPDGKFPHDLIDEVSENGWYYRFFRANGTDSMFGEETFRVDLKKLNKVRRENGEEELGRRKWEEVDDYGNFKSKIMDEK